MFFTAFHGSHIDVVMLCLALMWMALEKAKGTVDIEICNMTRAKWLINVMENNIKLVHSLIFSNHNLIFCNA